MKFWQKFRTGNWWFYILLGFSEAMGIDLEQQLGQAFLLFPRNVKTFFENSSLTREKEEAALPASLLTLCAPFLHTGTLQTWDLQRAPGWVCAHTQTLPASPHSAMLQPGECPAGSPRELLWISVWGLMFLQEQSHGSRQDDSTDLPKLPQH